MSGLLVTDLERLGYMPPAVVQAFVALGNAQRNKPEHAMVRLQTVNGGGVLNGVAEHLGDLTHRMTEMLRYYRGEGLPPIELLGYEFVVPKVQRCIKALRHGYGFEREALENINTNAKFFNRNPETQKEAVLRASKAYAAAHAQLRTYNKAQYYAQQAAIFFGLWKFDRAEQFLSYLETLCHDPKAYQARVGAFVLEKDGEPLPYTLWPNRLSPNKPIPPIAEEGKAEEHLNGTYAAMWLTPASANQLYTYYVGKIDNLETPDKFHITTTYSRVPVNLSNHTLSITLDPKTYEYDQFGDEKNVLVLKVKSDKLQQLFQWATKKGATFDYPSYQPHITLSTNFTSGDLPPVPPFQISLRDYRVAPLED